MDSHKAIIFILISLLLGAAIFVVVANIPSSAVNGGNPVTVCNLQMTVSGNYEDALLAHWIGNFEFNYSVSGCHTETLLDLLPAPSSFNIFPFTLTFTATLTDSSGANHCQSSSGGICSLSAQIGAGQVSQAFTASTTVNNIPVGGYLVSLNSPYPLNSYNGATTYSQNITVSGS